MNQTNNMKTTNVDNDHVRSAMQADISFTAQGLDEAFLNHPCPQSGDPNGGVNDYWLPSMSRRCHMAGLTEDEAYDRLRDGSADCGRRVTDKEIWRAISWIYSTPLPDGLSRETKPKIRANDELIEAITSDLCPSDRMPSCFPTTNPRSYPPWKLSRPKDGNGANRTKHYSFAQAMIALALPPL
jgi:hypothetical protein